MKAEMLSLGDKDIIRCCKCGCGEIIIRGNGIFLRGHGLRTLEVKNKSKKTCIDKYGVDNVFKSNTIKTKIIATCLEKYGVEHPYQAEEIRKKGEKTTLEKFGVDNVFRSKNTQNKIKQTNLKKLGVDNPSKSKDIWKKIKQTWLLNFGVEHPLQSEAIRNKCIRTCLNRYGVENPRQAKEVQEKGKLTCIKKYGVDNFSKTIQGRQICRENFLRLISDQECNGEPIVPRIGSQERLCLNELQSHISYNIQRNPCIIGYFPDGYIKELSVVIEFDERHHFIDNYITHTEKDIQKDKDYIEKGFHCFRIKKIEWDKNNQNIIDMFLKFLNKIQMIDQKELK